MSSNAIHLNRTFQYLKVFKVLKVLSLLMKSSSESILTAGGWKAWKSNPHSIFYKALNSNCNIGLHNAVCLWNTNQYWEHKANGKKYIYLQEHCFFWGVFAQPKNKINKCLQKVRRPYYVRRNGGKHSAMSSTSASLKKSDKVRRLHSF